MTHTVALVQARMSSSRFPGKVLAELDGRPMIGFMVERARRARRVDEVIVVTSVDPSDDPLASWLDGAGLPVFRGSLDDVLDRYGAAAAQSRADIVVRLTGDCPLIDPAVIDAVVALRAAKGVDYCSNIEPPTFADGLDVECFKRTALDRARRESSAPAEREHVTLWMRSEAAALRRANLVGLADTSHLRLTVDYPDDLETVRRVVQLVGGGATDFDQYDIYRCLDANRDLLTLNRHARNEGLKKSMALSDEADAIAKCEE